MKKTLVVVFTAIFAITAVLVSSAYANERLYTVVKVLSKSTDAKSKIIVQAQSGNKYKIVYSPKIGIVPGDKVVVMFDGKKRSNALRITNSKTSASSPVFKFKRVKKKK